MLKPYGTCKLCESNKFLNFAGLCKSCNSKKEGSKIISEAFEKQKITLKAQKEFAEQKAAEPEPEPAVEETGEETEDKEEGAAETEDKEKEDEKDSK